MWLTTIVEHMPDPVVLLDAQGRIKQMNRAALALTSATDGQLDRFGNPLLFDLRRPTGEVLAPAESPFVRALVHREFMFGEELVVKTEGRDVPVLVNAAPVYDPQGAAVGAAIGFQDIRALKEIDRLREEWTSVVAHDLRQPVTIIRMTAQLLEHMCAGMPEAHAQLDRVLRAWDQLNRMIADLLDMSRIEAKRMTLARMPCDLVQLIRAVVHDLAAITAPHPVKVYAPRHEIAMTVDGGRMTQVLGNLLSNATKYSFPDSDIIVDVREREDGAEITVTNHGKGIPADELGQIFNRFARSSTSRQSNIAGLGLGLFISKGLVEAHGGRIWAESRPDEATTFHVFLPALASARESPGPVA